MAKILHVIQILTLGGGARALMSTAKFSGRKGDFEHAVLSILPPEEKAAQLAIESGLRVIAAPDAARMKAEIEAADIVQMHWWNVPEMTDFLRARHPAMRLIGFYHVAGDSLPHIIGPKMIKYVDMSVPCNPYTYYDNASFRGMDPERKLASVELVYGAADLTRLDGLRPRAHQGFNVGYIGTVDFIKMHPDYVKMSSSIRIPEVKFVVCGDGSLDVLREQARELGTLDRFDIRGYVNDVRPAIEEFDVYGYPLCEETYAGSELNLQEVMYAGLSPVVFPYGGVKRLVVHDYTGYIVHSALEYRQAIEHLYHHPAERRRMGANAAAYARQIFGAENAARKINSVYARMLERPKRDREWPLDASASGAAVYIDTLGPAGGDYAASRSAIDLRAMLAADARIASSTRVEFISGILAYLGRYPKDPWLHYWAGLAFAKSGRHAEAAGRFAEAISNGLPHWIGRWRLMLATEAMGRGDLAKTVGGQLQAQQPDYLRLLESAERPAPPDRDRTSAALLAGPAFITHPQPAVAAAAPAEPMPAANVTASSVVKPGQPGETADAGVLRAEATFAEGRPEEAEAILRQVLAANPRHARALNNIGVMEHSRGRVSQAGAAFLEAYKADPRYEVAALNLMDTLRDAGKAADAAALGYRFLDLRPDEPTILKATAALEEEWADSLLARSKVRDLNYRKRPYRITALVSTYKSAAFMAECLDDLERQTIARDLEIVIVDADSPQGEDAIVEEYQRRFDNIRYIRTPERIGIYPAWNLAIRAAAGEFLTPMSTNDRLAPDAYERLLSAFEANPAIALAYGDSDLTEIPHQEFGKHVPCPDYGGKFEWPEYAFEDLLVNCRIGPHPVWRKSLHPEIGYFNGRYKAIGDQDFWLRIGINHPLMHIPAVTGLAWITKDSLSGDKSSMQEIIEIHEKHAAAHLDRCRKRIADPDPAAGPATDWTPAKRAGGEACLLPARYAVAAVVSSFDSERFMRGCLEDLTSQTLFLRGDMEIIVVDSGSRQDERSIVEEYQALHPRIVYIRSERESIYAAWNRAALASRSRYLVNANADDRHRPDAFAIMASELDRTDAQDGPGLVYCDALLTAGEDETFERNSASRVWSLPDWNLRQALVDCPFGCTVMWRRVLHAELGLFDESFRIAGDYEFFFRAGLERGARRIPKALTLYLERPHSLSYGPGGGVDGEVNGFLSPFRRKLALERIYPFLRSDPSPQAEAAALVDLAAYFIDPFAGRQAPGDALARLNRAYDLLGPTREILFDMALAAADTRQAEVSQAFLARLVSMDPDFAGKLQAMHKPGTRLLFRLAHPGLQAMPPVVPVGDTRVPLARYSGEIHSASIKGA